METKEVFGLRLLWMPIRNEQGGVATIPVFELPLAFTCLWLETKPPHCQHDAAHDNDSGRHDLTQSLENGSKSHDESNAGVIHGGASHSLDTQRVCDCY